MLKIKINQWIVLMVMNADCSELKRVRILKESLEVILGLEKRCKKY